MSKPTVSVVVPAYNCAQTIAQTIESLLKQTNPFSQIVIVDDGSTDDTAAVIKSFDSVKFIYQDNAGPACARNTGAKAANTEWVVFTDSDCIAHQDWCEKLSRGFSESKHGAVMGSYGIANSSSLLARCVHGEILYRHRCLMPKYPQAFGSYNVAICKKIFEEVGGFDETYRNASGEDNDLSYKILQSGYKIYFEQEALVDHFHPQKVYKYLKEQYRHGFWRVKMYQNHPQMIKGDDYTYWKDIVEMPLALGMIVLFGASFFAGWAWNAWIFLTVVLSFIELYGAYVTLKKPFESIFWSFVLFFRAFARFFGLSSGVVLFFTSKILKKT